MSPALRRLLSTLFLFVACAARTQSVYAADQAQRTDSLELTSLINKSIAFINRKGSITADMKAASNYAGQAADLSRKHHIKWGEAASCNLFSQIYREKGDNKTGKAYAEKALSLSETVPVNILQQADALMELSNYYGLDYNDLQKKVSYYFRAVNILKSQAPGTRKLADALKFLGDLYHLQLKTDSALIKVQDALAIYKAIKYDTLQDVYSLAGEIAIAQRNMKLALKYELQGAALSSRYRDSSRTTISIYNRMGTVYTELRQYGKAVQAYQKAIEYARFSSNGGERILTANLGRALIYAGKSKEAYALLIKSAATCPKSDTISYILHNAFLLDACLILKRLDVAKLCFDRLNSEMKGHKTDDNFMFNYHYRCVAFLAETKQFKLIPAHLNPMIGIADRTQETYFQAPLELLQYRIDSMKNEPWQAIAHYKKYHLYQDSLSKRNHDKEISQMEILYETDKKDRDIAEKSKSIDELHKRGELQRKMIDSEKTSKSLSIAGMTLLTILLFVGYSRYRLKIRTAKDLEIKQKAINLQNEKLKQLVKEREWLLVEVHHRVKNNLQIIISLLDSQSEYLHNKSAEEVIRESRNRMNSISLVHQKLYRQDAISGIPMETYLSELIEYIKDSFNLEGKILFIQKVMPVILDVSQVVPLGLIFNEAVTNAIKYAFPGNQRPKNPQIIIELAENTASEISFVIQDNGTGLPENFKMEDSDSLGMQLISGLTTQLKGILVIENNIGLRIEIRFKKLFAFGSAIKSSE